MRKFLFLTIFFFTAFADIPSKIHFIWIGPKELSKESKINIDVWKKNHPDFEVFLWTDVLRDGLSNSINQKIIDDTILGECKMIYQKSTNFGEKAHIIKYQILEKFGGVYLEPDLVFRKNISQLLKQNFFATLSEENIPIIGKSESVANYILASEPNNPIIKKILEQIKKEFDEIGELFLGKDPEAITYRLYYRTLRPLDSVVCSFKEQNIFKGSIYPLGYFNDQKGQIGKYSSHAHQMSWNSTETEFDRYLKGQILKAEKKITKVKFSLIGLIVFLVLIEACRFVFRKKKVIQT